MFPGPMFSILSSSHIVEKQNRPVSLPDIRTIATQRRCGSQDGSSPCVAALTLWNNPFRNSGEGNAEIEAAHMPTGRPEARHQLAGTARVDRPRLGYRSSVDPMG